LLQRVATTWTVICRDVWMNLLVNRSIHSRGLRTILSDAGFASMSGTELNSCDAHNCWLFFFNPQRLKSLTKYVVKATVNKPIVFNLTKMEVSTCKLFS
jgi:hypothetical protein